MKILAIETSTLIGSIALTCDHHLLAEYQMEIKATYSDTLLIFIDRILQDAHISIGEIDGYALAQGPGSFTALRIGMSVVKGLALATRKPMVGISSLDGLAYNMCFTNILICPILDARKGEVYTAFYKKRDDGTFKKLTPDRVVDPKKLLDEIQEEVVFLGDGSYLYRNLILSSLKGKALFAPVNLNYPKASSIACLASHKFKSDEILNLDFAAPVYVRSPEAEIKWRGKIAC